MPQRRIQNGYAEAIVATITQPLLVLDVNLRVERANAAFVNQFQVTAGETEGRLIYELGHGQWDIPELRRLLEDFLTRNGQVAQYRVEHDFPQLGRRSMVLSARRMRLLGVNGGAKLGQWGGVRVGQ
jgi:two-component system CheB/CheR fusion protein